MRYALLALVALVGCHGLSAPEFGHGGDGSMPVGGNGGSGGGDTGSGTGGDTGSDTGGEPAGGDTAVQLEGTGYSVGDTAYNLQGTGPFGSPFSLWSLYGRKVVLAVGHMDDTAFHDSAHGSGIADFVAAAAADGGAVPVLLVGRNAQSVQATQADAQQIASETGVAWVLTDPDGSLVNTWAERNPPKTYVIDDHMVIAWTAFGATTQSAVEQALSQAR